MQHILSFEFDIFLISSVVCPWASEFLPTNFLLLVGCINLSLDTTHRFKMERV